MALDVWGELSSQGRGILCAALMNVCVENTYPVIYPHNQDMYKLLLDDIETTLGPIHQTHRIVSPFSEYVAL